MYGDALLTRTRAVFDELRQGIKDIEFLADPTGGEVRIGCSVAASVTFLRPIIRGFSEVHPGAALRVENIPAAGGSSACVSESATSSCNGSCRHTQVTFLQAR
jgi:DNA-binding transcriptional LysR family regulator